MNWNSTRAEVELASKIAKRALVMAMDAGIELDCTELVMDIEATHLNGCPLKLDALLSADDLNFSHDVFGIRRYLDRSTGKLTDCFVPRYAA